MGIRSPLKGKAPRLLGNHGGTEGKRYRRAYDALEEELGPFASRLIRFEAGRAAIAMINVESATRALVAARRKRENGRGRRPNARRTPMEITMVFVCTVTPSFHAILRPSILCLQSPRARCLLSKTTSPSGGRW